MSGKLDHYIDCNDALVRTIELQLATHMEQIKTMTADISEQGERIDSLNARYGIWGSINSIGTVIAGILGIRQ
jgi:galactitol-specific phosphotransferase system IIC component